MIYRCLLNSCNSMLQQLNNNLVKKLCISRKRCLCPIAMIITFILCSTLTFAHTVTGSPGYGMLCPISDTEYIDTNQNTVSEYYECPDPLGDQSRTECCIEEEPKKDYQSHKDLVQSIIRGDTRHKCCLPPIPLDSVLKVNCKLGANKYFERSDIIIPLLSLWNYSLSILS